MQFAEAVVATYKIFKTIDTIVFSCYHSVFEYYLALTFYTATIGDWKKLLYNLAHNLGNIYDLTEELVYRMKDAEKDYLRLFFWDRTGFIVGTLFQDILEDPKDYYEYDPNVEREEWK